MTVGLKLWAGCFESGSSLDKASKVLVGGLTVMLRYAGYMRAGRWRYVTPE